MCSATYKSNPHKRASNIFIWPHKRQFNSKKRCSCVPKWKTNEKTQRLVTPACVFRQRWWYLAFKCLLENKLNLLNLKRNTRQLWVANFEWQLNCMAIFCWVFRIVRLIYERRSRIDTQGNNSNGTTSSLHAVKVAEEIVNISTFSSLITARIDAIARSEKLPKPLVKTVQKTTGCHLIRNAIERLHKKMI